MATSTTSIEQLSINTIRTLSMDAVQRAGSGHPGTPMALAPVTYRLWNNTLNFNPEDPAWPARDRFVLSCGHASMLLYSVLHLAGVKNAGGHGAAGHGAAAISLEDIKNFRQLGSPCAGHPEFGEAGGIETTTGPLGQGVGNSVGMALAARWLAARYNRPGFELFDYNTYALCSDGDVMEGVGCEAASIAGHLQLGNLCWIYDDNKITIEGATDLAFSEDVARRFEGLGWNAVRVADANDLSAIDAALEAFLDCRDKPTIIVLRSVIACGAPNKQGTAGAHGAPLGEDEVQLTKQAYDWPFEPFHVPREVLEHFASGVGARGKEQQQVWREQFAQYRSTHPEPAGELEKMWAGELPAGWDADIPEFEASEKGLATRASSGKVLNAVAANIPWLAGGSADLAPSTKTLLEFDGAGDLSAANPGGRNLHFGVREHAMAAICNGMALSGLRAYGATFFGFTDYMRPPMRLASMMKQNVFYVLTHDSIGLGEDGPTHQPVEHLAACRAIPGLLVVRPGDANEVAEAYRTLIGEPDRPTALVLSRQNVPTLDRTKYNSASGVSRGGYILAGVEDETPQVILIGTGTELPICVDAYVQLTSAGISTRVVSMPCCELFDEQDEIYRQQVLPPNVLARVAVEAGVIQGWEKYLGPQGRFVGMSSFGASAPFEQLYEHFGITAERVVEEANAALAEES